MTFLMVIMAIISYRVVLVLILIMVVVVMTRLIIQLPVLVLM